VEKICKNISASQIMKILIVQMHFRHSHDGEEYKSEEHSGNYSYFKSKENNGYHRIQ
jgi:hypothetical protein